MTREEISQHFGCGTVEQTYENSKWFSQVCHEIKKIISQKARKFAGFPCFFLMFVL